LKTSQEVRLQRLSRTSIYKAKEQVLIYPMKAGVNIIETLLAFLGELYPRA
jgi:hypothetical protein